LKIRLLPSSAGRESQYQCLTSFLINDQVAIDGGSLGFALAPGEMGAVRHIVITHAHSDHTASLPIYIAEAFTALDAPVAIYSTPEVIRALREFMFNDQMWPNFENILLANGSGPTITFHALSMRNPVAIQGLKVTAFPVNHIVPTVGLLVEDARGAVMFTSDTYTTDEIWEAASSAENLKAIFVDVSYPNELEHLAIVSKHLTPQLLKSELRKLGRDADIYAVHIKPSNREDVVRQLDQLGDRRVQVAEIDRLYEW
jgi:cAMP phosphodiesterase